MVKLTIHWCCLYKFQTQMIFNINCYNKSMPVSWLNTFFSKMISHLFYDIVSKMLFHQSIADSLYMQLQSGFLQLIGDTESTELNLKCNTRHTFCIYVDNCLI
jgi:hypothetical protein